MSEITINSTLNDSSTWAPPGETAADIYLEHINFRGLLVIAVAYGFLLAVAVAALYFLLFKPINGRRQWGQIAYVVVMLAGGTIYFGPQAKWTELMFIDDRNIPGGPNTFFFTQTGQFTVVFSTAAYVVDNFLADALMLYRCALIWNFNWLVIIIPALWLIASTVLSFLLLVEAARPDIPFKIDFALPYFPLAMSLNIFLALLTAGKLLWARHKLKGTLGSAHTQIYGSVASMIIESSSLYSITSLAYIIMYAQNNPAASEVLGLLGEVMCIAPVLIILRVAYGRGITRETVAGTTSAMQFTSTNGGTAGGSTLNVKMTTDTHNTVTGSAYELKRMHTDV